MVRSGGMCRNRDTGFISINDPSPLYLTFSEIESYIHLISKFSRKNWENKVLLTLTVIVADYILAMNII